MKIFPNLGIYTGNPFVFNIYIHNYLLFSVNIDIRSDYNFV